MKRLLAALCCALAATAPLAGCRVNRQDPHLNQAWRLQARRFQARVHNLTPAEQAFFAELVGAEWYRLGESGYYGADVNWRRLKRIDFLAGCATWVFEPDSLLDYLPLGVWAFEWEGAIARERVFWGRPALGVDLLAVGLAAASASGGFVVVLPILTVQEEIEHVRQEVLWRDLSDWAARFHGWLTLDGVPVLGAALDFLLYYAHPMELDAKVRKLGQLGFARNLDCAAAYDFYLWQLDFAARSKLRAQGFYPTPARVGQEIAALRGIVIRPEYVFWAPSLYDGVFSLWAEPYETAAPTRSFPRIFR